MYPWGLTGKSGVGWELSGLFFVLNSGAGGVYVLRTVWDADGTRIFGVSGKCGREVGDLVQAVAYTRLDRHLHTLGILWIVIGGLFVIPAVGLLAIFGGSARFILHQEEPIAGLLPVLLYVAAGTLGLLAAGGAWWVWV